MLGFPLKFVMNDKWMNLMSLQEDNDKYAYYDIFVY